MHGRKVSLHWMVDEDQGGHRGLWGLSYGEVEHTVQQAEAERDLRALRRLLESFEKPSTPDVSQYFRDSAQRCS